MSDATANAHVYADAVECPNCGAKIGKPCTFIHFATKQKIVTSYCNARLQKWMRTEKAK